jgi:hypothetical protein
LKRSRSSTGRHTTDDPAGVLHRSDRHCRQQHQLTRFWSEGADCSPGIDGEHPHGSSFPTPSDPKAGGLPPRARSTRLPGPSVRASWEQISMIPATGRDFRYSPRRGCSKRRSDQAWTKSHSSPGMFPD